MMCSNVSRGTASSISTHLGEKVCNVSLCQKKKRSRKYVWWILGKGEVVPLLPISLLLCLYTTLNKRAFPTYGFHFPHKYFSIYNSTLSL